MVVSMVSNVSMISKYIWYMAGYGGRKGCIYVYMDAYMIVSMVSKVRMVSRYQLCTYGWFLCMNFWEVC